MHTFIERLLKRAPLLTDGAWGTQLQARGLPVGACPDVWNLEAPQHVEAVARAYVEAGSDIILTNTFGANRVRLNDYGAADKAVAINRAGAEISRRAADKSTFVFASMGPSGQLLAMGDVDEDELRAAFDEQAQAICAAGAEAIVIETMADLDEAKIALAAAKATQLPVVVCMVFDAGADRDRTMMGATPEQVAEELSEAGADVIGANCGNGIAGYVPVCRRLRAATQLPIWIKANAGLPQMQNGEVVYNTTPQEFASHLSELIEAGASFIGGCCGTTPAHIRALCEARK